mgnify:CR=1 FL=1
MPVYQTDQRDWKRQILGGGAGAAQVLFVTPAAP